MKGLEEIFPGEQGPVLLTSPQAIFYTTGFYTTARRPNQIGNQCVLMDEQFTLFFCPRNWGDVIRPQLDSQITLIPCDPSPAALAEAVCRALPRKPERLGLEEETIILPLYLALREQLPETSLWDVTSRLYRARMKKTPAEIAGLLQARCEKLTEIPEKVDFFDALPDYGVEFFTNKKSKTDPAVSLEMLKTVRPLLAELPAWDDETLLAAMKDLAERLEVKNAKVMWPVRIAVSGRAVTPGGAVEICRILGRDETLRRIDAGIAKLEG